MASWIGRSRRASLSRERRRKGYMHPAFGAGDPYNGPRFADVAAVANAPVADDAGDGSPQLVALAFDANGHYTPTVLDHPVNDTPRGEAA